MRILVTGITGYVGAALAPRLVAAGHDVVGLSRDPARVTVPGVEAVGGDALTGRGLRRALAGADIAYYLIHSMESGAGDGGFPGAERRAATRFAREARRAGVERIVYLGGLVPRRERISPHLGSRLAVEEVLLAEVPGSVALRASIVIGARSRSFRFMVRLVERMPVLPLPPWAACATQPIDGRDALAMLVRAATAPGIGGRSLDIAGPDVLTYGDMIERIRDHLLVGRPGVRFPLSLTPVTSRLAAAVAGEDPGFIEPLMGSLGTDLLPRDMVAPDLLGVRLHSFDAAVERALAEWERDEELAGR